jgi:hypothetical protein
MLKGTMIVRPPEPDGAVDYAECHPCRTRWPACVCGRCRRCGYQKHTAIHGPMFGKLPGSEPFGHRFTAEPADG